MQVKAIGSISISSTFQKIILKSLALFHTAQGSMPPCISDRRTFSVVLVAAPLENHIHRNQISAHQSSS